MVSRRAKSRIKKKARRQAGEGIEDGQSDAAAVQTDGETEGQQNEERPSTEVETEVNKESTGINEETPNETDCQPCGYHANDVKPGGEVPEKGKRIGLEVKTAEDLRRDILKRSDSYLLKISECKIEVVPSTKGRRFTTVECFLV